MTEELFTRNEKADALGKRVENPVTTVRISCTFSSKTQTSGEHFQMMNRVLNSVNMRI